MKTTCSWIREWLGNICYLCGIVVFIVSLPFWFTGISIAVGLTGLLVCVACGLSIKDDRPLPDWVMYVICLPGKVIKRMFSK